MLCPSRERKMFPSSISVIASKVPPQHSSSIMKKPRLTMSSTRPTRTIAVRVSSKQQRIVSVLSSLIIIAMVRILLATAPSSSSSSSSSTIMGDADLTFLKTNPELSQKLVKLSSSSTSAESSSSSSSYDLAINESHGFFHDISNNHWNMMKLKAQAMQPNTRGNPYSTDHWFAERLNRPETWFQNNYEPEFVCSFERRIGRLGDGGKWICDPHRISQKKKECLVYSVGSNGDASFEAAILQDISMECEIHVFDFGNYAPSVAQQTNYKRNVHYHQWGISDTTGGTYKTLQDTVKELHHTGRTIDIFKIDCEGCEMTTFSSWLDVANKNAGVTLQQIVVELHPSMSHLRPSMKLPETVQFFTTLHKHGYAITHKEPNIQYTGEGICVEYNFLLLSPEFWNNVPTVVV